MNFLLVFLRNFSDILNCSLKNQENSGFGKRIKSHGHLGIFGKAKSDIILVPNLTNSISCTVNRKNTDLQAFGVSIFNFGKMLSSKSHVDLVRKSLVFKIHPLAWRLERTSLWTEFPNFSRLIPSLRDQCCEIALHCVFSDMVLFSNSNCVQS